MRAKPKQVNKLKWLYELPGYALRETQKKKKGSKMLEWPGLDLNDILHLNGRADHNCIPP